MALDLSSSSERFRLFRYLDLDRGTREVLESRPLETVIEDKDADYEILGQNGDSSASLSPRPIRNHGEYSLLNTCSRLNRHMARIHCANRGTRLDRLVVA